MRIPLAVGLVELIITSSLHAAEKPPNVILILADDLGAKELTCYGSTKHRTPNLDRMAAEGTRFETFYAMPLCTPTRVCLMTGQYGFHNGFLGMQDPTFKPKADSPKADIANHFTHADLMKSKGYATAQAGKWQLSGKLPTLVRDTGFDDYLMWAYDHNLPAGVKHPGRENGAKASRFWHPSLIRNGEYLPTTPDDYGPDMLNEFVLDFARRNKTNPFFVYYTSVLTHGPHLETPNPSLPGQRWPAGFKSNLEYLDHLMGELLDGLKAEGLDENTYVIFIGDNGTGSDGKGTLTELGARVPSIIRGPGVQRGFVSRAVADLTDIMPTLADISGAELPKDVPFDGHSLVPVLRGEKEKHRDWIYSHLDDGRVLRDSRWLLEIDKAGKGERFFDCGDSRDGSGYKDVTTSTDPEIIAARQHFAEILAAMPELKPNDNANTRPAAKASKAKSGSSRFTTRDQNNDGSIDHTEFVATATTKNKDSIETRFRKMDANSDGRIAEDEFDKMTAAE
jgi:arylsulfatase A